MAKPAEKPGAKSAVALSERLRKFVAEAGGDDGKKDNRIAERAATYVFARVGVDANLEVDCVIRDVSDGGVRIKLEEPRPLPSTVRITIPETGQSRIGRVAWQRAQHAGIHFSGQKRKAYKALSADEEATLED
ncbi:MAG: PilZ domain-containing protein [Pseudomonadota bacterium]